MKSTFLRGIGLGTTQVILLTVAFASSFLDENAYDLALALEAGDNFRRYVEEAGYSLPIFLTALVLIHMYMWVKTYSPRVRLIGQALVTLYAFVEILSMQLNYVDLDENSAYLNRTESRYTQRLLWNRGDYEKIFDTYGEALIKPLKRMLPD